MYAYSCPYMYTSRSRPLRGANNILKENLLAGKTIIEIK